MHFSGTSLINGMAAVIGGVSEDEFLQSIEFLDNSPEEGDGSPLAMDWRIAAHSLSRPRERLKHIPRAR